MGFGDQFLEAVENFQDNRTQRIEARQETYQVRAEEGQTLINQVSDAATDRVNAIGGLISGTLGATGEFIGKSGLTVDIPGLGSLGNPTGSGGGGGTTVVSAPASSSMLPIAIIGLGGIALLMSSKKR
jgi:hypothetical protein